MDRQHGTRNDMENPRKLCDPKIIRKTNPNTVNVKTETNNIANIYDNLIKQITIKFNIYNSTIN